MALSLTWISLRLHLVNTVPFRAWLFFLILSSLANLPGTVQATEGPQQKDSPLRNFVVQKLKTQSHVSLELFVMSQCPYGVRAEQAIIPIVKEFRGQVDFKLHYIVSMDATGTIQSLHGPAEVAENTRQLLIAKHYPDQWLEYLSARARNYHTNAWQKAATQAGIDSMALSLLIQQNPPDQLLSTHSQQTQQRNIHLSPSVFVNGERYQGAIQAPSLPIAKNSIAAGCLTATDCNDNNACTSDVCDVNTGFCTNTPIICDDYNACTIDQCDPLVGCTHQQVTCDDYNPATGDYCDASTGCNFVACDASKSVNIISQPPVGSAVCTGSSISIGVSATVSNGSLKYQWYHDGNALTGISSATTATLSLTNVQSTNAGVYSVSITGICNSTSSTSFMLSLGGGLGAIASLVADESGCPVKLVGRATGSLFTFTGPGGYVFSNVFRQPGTYDVVGLEVKTPGTYILQATSCSGPSSQSVTVSRSCP